MLNDSYRESIQWLFQQFPSYQVIGSKAYKPTLDNTCALLDFIGNPEENLKFVHVAGSNGKGSVCSYVASTLTEAGYTVGLFTSPHIKDFSERIRINGDPIDEQAVIEFVERIRSTTFDFSPSFFEVTFALALKYFTDQKCDICVIETGLGGRLDATNVITPLIAAITSISLEHTNILGDSVYEIASEKAGIIKQEIPVIVGKLEEEAMAAIEERARLLNAKVIHPIELEIPEVIRNFLLADYQLENIAIARSLLHELNELGFPSTDINLEKGLTHLEKNTGFRGRLQVISEEPLIILDASHNPAGIMSTLSAIKNANKGELHILLGVSNDKDFSTILKLLPEDAHFYLTEFSNERSASIAQLQSHFDQTNLSSVSYFTEPEVAFEVAKKSSEKNDTILVIGSFFLLEHFF